MLVTEGEYYNFTWQIRVLRAYSMYRVIFTSTWQIPLHCIMMMWYPRNYAELTLPGYVTDVSDYLFSA